jgi:hypothetical protein
MRSFVKRAVKETLTRLKRITLLYIMHGHPDYFDHSKQMLPKSIAKYLLTASTVFEGLFRTHN